MYNLIVETNFAAAHNIRGYKGKCERIHGHNWKVQVVLISEKLDNLGMVMDFNDVKEMAHCILERFDHTHLNKLDEFAKENPTTENLATILYNELSKKLPAGITVSKVTAWESENCGASYYKE
ncbi:MAG TPA: 6-carboxytetrahydropterin synthase QueD [Candidatus Brocadiia bacterium]|nr:6-carboxytetrahydropterin synthase QueD [Planctomycetota bacterium]MBI4008315.1 6-carboxytetrahydropterin synthase QueD [Planctomycetota bacterium]